MDELEKSRYVKTRKTFEGDLGNEDDDQNTDRTEEAKSAKNQSSEEP